MAHKRNLLVEQGTTFRFGFYVTLGGVPLGAGWSARAQIRPTQDSPLVLYTFAPTISNSVVLLEIPSTDTTTILWASAVYDVEIYDGSTPPVVHRVAEGTVSISREVTR